MWLPEGVVHGVAVIGAAEVSVAVVDLHVPDADSNFSIRASKVHYSGQRQLIKLNVTAFYPCLRVVTGRQVSDKIKAYAVRQLNVEVQVGSCQVEARLPGHRGGCRVRRFAIRSTRG